MSDHVLLEILEDEGVQNIEPQIFIEIDKLKDEIKLREDPGVMIYDYENKIITVGCKDKETILAGNDGYYELVSRAFGDTYPEYAEDHEGVKGTHEQIFAALENYYDGQLINDYSAPFIGDDENICFVTYVELKDDYVEMRYNMIKLSEYKTLYTPVMYMTYNKDINAYVIISQLVFDFLVNIL